MGLTPSAASEHMIILSNGMTRTRVTERYALIAPDGHVPSTISGFEGALVNTLISPAMGANLTQLMVTFGEEGGITFESEDVETFIYVMEGDCLVEIEDHAESLEVGGFAFLPAGIAWEVDRPEPGTRLTIFQKYFDEDELAGEPSPVFGNSDEIQGQAFLGDPDAVLKTLLPESLSFDMAVNLFTFQPGARLPFVETHVMEHGLILLEGEGIYRLDNDWHPVSAGDAIWMAPYCPQWFAAIGKTPATYLYYKDINRHPMG